MARVTCGLDDVLLAVRDRLVSRNIVTATQAYIADVTDELPMAPPAPPLAGVTFEAFDQRPDTICVDTDPNVIYAEGFVVVTLWNRIEIDREGRADSALTDAAFGAAKLIKDTLAALNDYDPMNGSGDFILARALISIGTRNRGKYKPEPSWRRFEVRASAAFHWQLA